MRTSYFTNFKLFGESLNQLILRDIEELSLLKMRKTTNNIKRYFVGLILKSTGSDGTAGQLVGSGKAVCRTGLGPEDKYRE